MKSLDTPFLDGKNQNEHDVPFFSISLRYGLILAGLGIIFTILQFMSSIKWLSWVSLLISIAILVYANREHQRQDLGGFISFKRVFRLSFLANIVSGAIASVFNFVYIKFINPSVLEDIIAQIRSDSERNNTPEEAINIAIEWTTWMFSSVGGIFITFFIVLISGAIISLILAAILKRNRPMFS